jgi:hypothetical protein
MLDVDGPLSGMFAEGLIPEDGDKGVVAACGGGEMSIEFQSRSVRDNAKLGIRRRQVGNDTTWTLTTGVQVEKC